MQISLPPGEIAPLRHMVNEPEIQARRPVREQQRVWLTIRDRRRKAFGQNFAAEQEGPSFLAALRLGGDRQQWLH